MKQNGISEKVRVSGCAKYEVRDGWTKSARHVKSRSRNTAGEALSQYRACSCEGARRVCWNDQVIRGRCAGGACSPAA